ncbi:uncharacterized protein DS421_18g625810 [Arachis hypogaea]|nr:uncharacterized protein DS421_18g625810 [Arachis hypogaea]
MNLKCQWLTNWLLLPEWSRNLWTVDHILQDMVACSCGWAWGSWIRYGCVWCL